MRKTITEKVKDYIEKLDVTTATLYTKDRKILEELRIEHIYESKQDIGVTDFLSHVIKFYKEKRRR